MTIGGIEMENIHRLRGWVFSQAKLRWGFSVAFGYLAIVAFPVACLIGSQEWGPLAAAVLAIFGRMCLWWSECYRGDAEWILRAIEFKRGIGHEIDTVKLADLNSKYSRGFKKHVNSVGDDNYYEASGNPSYSLFIKMVIESAWWTEQLAKKASKLVFIVMGVLAAVSVFVLGVLEVDGETDTTHASEISWRAYGLAICLIVLLDTFNLGVKYRGLSMAARESMESLTGLLDQANDISATPRLMAAVSGYQYVRKEGPLIPDWFKRWHESSLQRVWGETLSMNESRG